MGYAQTNAPFRQAVAAALVVAWAAASNPVAEAGDRGRIDFASADLPPATVEVDLSPELFGDLFGLVDAAVAGVAESLDESASADANDDATRLAAAELAEARQLVRLLKEVVHEVRVRVYDDVPDKSLNVATLAANFDGQLAAGEWENVVKVRDGEDSVRISLLRDDGAVAGAFVIAADGQDIVLANVVCDISPENVKRISAAATKIGLDLGLQEEIQRKFGGRGR